MLPLEYLLRLSWPVVLFALTAKSVWSVFYLYWDFRPREFGDATVETKELTLNDVILGKSVYTTFGHAMEEPLKPINNQYSGCQNLARRVQHYSHSRQEWDSSHKSWCCALYLATYGRHIMMQRRRKAGYILIPAVSYAVPSSHLASRCIRSTWKHPSDCSKKEIAGIKSIESYPV